ncbi:hypothetical protein AB205_0135100, partial [Aquarana catesbeiana]
IEVDGGDVKALFRRSQALEKLGRIDQAILDLRRCLTLEPKNKVFLEAVRNLGVQAQEKAQLMSSTDSRVDQMFRILLDPDEKDVEKQQKAAQNLVVLAREDAGAEKIFQSDGVRLLVRLLDTKKVDMMLAALRTLVGLCTGHQPRTLAILNAVGMEKFCAVMAMDDESISLAACTVLNTMFDTLKEDMKKDIRAKEGAIVLGKLLSVMQHYKYRGHLRKLLHLWFLSFEDPSKELKSMIHHLLEMLIQPSVSSHGRENSLNLLIKVVPRKSLRDANNGMTLWVIDQGKQMTGLYPPFGGSSALRSWFEGHGMDGKLRAIQTVSCLLQGPSEAGNRTLELTGIMESILALCASEREIDQQVAVEALIHAAGKAKRATFITANGVTLLKDIYKKNENDAIRIRALVGPSEAGNRTLELTGIMESILALCASEREIDQQVAVEALIHAAGKAKRATFITANGVTLLKDIYKKNENDAIRIRALVGLCKLGSAGGTDFSMKQFAEGSTLKLAKQCRKWLCNESIQASTRRWAVEGLAYLTFDADVKEEFVEDKAALQAMFKLAKSQDKTVLFAVASTLVNCTNSYDREEIDPQMLELAKYAKQHVPEEHPKVRDHLVSIEDAGIAYCDYGVDLLKLECKIWCSSA